MNILWIPNFSPFPPDNGGKLLTYNRMAQVSKAHNIFMIVESDPFDEKQKVMADSFCKEYVVVPPVKHSKVDMIISAVIKCRNVEKYRNVNITKQIEHFLCKHQIDVINIDLPMPAVNILPIKNKLGGIPVIINQQNVEFHNCKSKIYTKGISVPLKMYSLIESKKLFYWERNLYKESIICANSFVSEDDLDLFRKSFVNIPDTEVVMPIGTNMPEDISKRAENGKIRVVFPASFDYLPNVHGAIWFVENVWPIIYSACKDVELYLVGRDPKPEVKALASDSVIVTGTVDIIEPYFAKADLFVVPIFFGGGVKTKVIEMGCWKRPVVSTAFGAKGTVYNEDDLLLRENVNEFAEACIEVLNHPERYDELTNSMFNKTEKNYLWNAVGERYIEFLKEVVANSKRGSCQ